MFKYNFITTSHHVNIVLLYFFSSAESTEGKERSEFQCQKIQDTSPPSPAGLNRIENYHGIKYIKILHSLACSIIFLINIALCKRFYFYMKL